MARRLPEVTIAVLVGMLFTGIAQASTEKILYSFVGSSGDGEGPNAAVVFDAAGNLYGTTEEGGSVGNGTVFKLSPGSSGTWTESVIYSFQNADGYAPAGSLIFDNAGNLYGTIYGGGPGGGGTVFKLSPTTGGSWTETILYGFSGPDGADPMANVIFDGAGNLYGTTSTGGALGGGTVFELTPNADGSWSESTLIAFPLNNEDSPTAPDSGLIFDAAGNLYGTTVNAGGKDFGNVFELSPSGGTWTIKSLHTFQGGPDGEYPEAAVIFDSAGNLYSTTVAGGTSSCGCGTVFRLNASRGYAEKVLHSFAGTPGNAPFAGLVLDSANNLYGVTYETSTRIGGSAFGINLNTGAFTNLHNFGGAGDGDGPVGTLILDSSGNLYGTTIFGGAFGAGTVYEITP